MKKVIVPNGARINLSTTFADLQIYANDRIVEIFDQVLSSYGIQIRNTDDTALQITKTASSPHNEIDIALGKGLSSSGEYINLGANLTAWSIGSQYLDSADHTVYIGYSGSQNTLTEVVNGFAYGTSENNTFTREDSSYNVTIDQDPGVSGFTLATINGDGIADLTVSDLRGTNILRLNDDLYDWQHTHNSGLDVHAVTTTAAAINTLFSNGVINYGNGAGDEFLNTSKIPSLPATVAVPSGQMYAIEPPTAVATTLRNNMATYNADQLSLGRITAGFTNTSSLKGFIESWRVANSGAALWHDVWADTAVINEYGNTISGLASDIVAWGYATNSGLGLSLPAGQAVKSFTANGLLSHLETTLGAQSSERADVNAGLAATGRTLTSQSALIRNNPALIRSKFRYKVDWDEPTLVDSEAIPKYNVISYTVGNGSWSSPPTKVQMDTNVIYLGATRDIDTFQTSEVSNTITTRETLTVASGVAGSTTVVYTTAPSATQIGDWAAAGTTGTDKNIVRTYSPADKNVTYAKAFTTALHSGVTTVEHYYTAATTSANTRTYWIDIDRDEEYIVYVQPVTEYGIEGAWSAGLYVNTNTLTDANSNTLLSLVQGQDEVNVAFRDAETATIRRDLEESVQQTNMAVAALPTFGNLKAVTNAVV